MSTTQMMPMALKALTRDGWLLFVTRFARPFAYGSLSVILVFYLIGLGLYRSAERPSVLTLTLAGDVVVSLYLTTPADRIGRRRDADHRRDSYGCCRFGVCLHTQSILPDSCGHHRRHQSQWQ